MIELDAIDYQIINILQKEGRTSFTSIAQQLKIPEATARYRFQRLEKEEIFHIRAFPNLLRMGSPQILFRVFFSMESSAIERVTESILELKEVQYAALIVGKFNLVADVNLSSHGHILIFFAKLTKISGIICYESQPIRALLKSERNFIYQL